MRSEISEQPDGIVINATMQPDGHYTSRLLGAAPYVLIEMKADGNTAVFDVETGHLGTGQDDLTSVGEALQIVGEALIENAGRLVQDADSDGT